MQLRIPISTLGASLDHMGDFPFKDPEEVRFDGPTLFLRGSRSHYVADDVLPLIGRFFPRFEVMDIDSGHWIISEKPEAFRRGMETSLFGCLCSLLLAVIDFIQKKDPSG